MLPSEGTPLPWLNIYKDSRVFDVSVKDFAEFSASPLLGSHQTLLPLTELPIGHDGTMETVPDLEELERLYGGDGTTVTLPLSRPGKADVGSVQLRLAFEPRINKDTLIHMETEKRSLRVAMQVQKEHSNTSQTITIAAALDL